MGRGRHARFFAKLGHKVEGVDTSILSKGLPEIIESEGLDFTYHRKDLRDFKIPEQMYSLIIASKILQLFRKADIKTIVQQMQAGLKPKGVIYICTTSIEDLQHGVKWKELEKVEENTFYYDHYKLYFHFFTRDEILGYFPDLKLHYYTEGLTYNRRPSISRHTGVIQHVGQRMR
jgi:tellurite methyltransferase